ncbi:MAG TPA: aldo/keto reductase [Polyangia bacterium]|jgi:diketogulonate reductase-like aldo/keto reductase
MSSDPKINKVIGRRPFGPLSDEVPVIGQGTWKMGRAGDRGHEVAALRAGLARGMTHIDTAEMYGSEEMIAEAIRDVPRDRLFLVSKVLPQNATRTGTIRACEASLRRLGVDHLDAYLLHWRGSVPLAETLGAMQALLQQGKIRALGVSNFDVDDLKEAEALLGGTPIACNQVLYHLGQRHIDTGLVAYCAHRGIAVVAYSPFGQGDFPGPRSPGRRILDAVAARHGATAHQVALAFLTRDPSVFAIPKTSSAAHAEDNSGALTLRLDPQDIAAIDAAFPARDEGSLPSN